jgi:hypothetical protein
MLKNILIVLVGMVFAQAAPIHAQTNGSGDFCSVAPIEALQALDGNWKITQSPGAATARTSQGAIAIPLPGHGPQSLSLDYDPLSGTALLEGAAPDELLLLLPANAQSAQIAVDALEQDGAGPSSAGGCDWASLPLMIGSNVYSLRPGPQSPNNGVFGQVLGVGFGYCYNGLAGAPSSNFSFFPGGPVPVPVVVQEGESEDCNPPTEAPQPAPGQMVMTMLVRFDSLNSGRGVLLFEGQQGGAQFSARAPISFSR